MCRTKMPFPHKKPPWKKIYAALPFVCKYCRGLFPDFKFYRRHIRSHESRYKKFWYSHEWRNKRRYSTSFLDDIQDDGYTIDGDFYEATNLKGGKLLRHNSCDPNYIRKSGVRSGRSQGAVGKGPRGGYTPRGITLEQAALIAHYQRIQLSKHKAPERFEYDSEDNMEDDVMSSYHDVLMRNVGALFLQQIEQCTCKDCLKTEEHINMQNGKDSFTNKHESVDGKLVTKKHTEATNVVNPSNKQNDRNKTLLPRDANMGQQEHMTQDFTGKFSVSNDRNQSEKRKHAVTSSNETRNQCPHCPISFDHADRLVLHIQNHYRLAKAHLAGASSAEMPLKVNSQLLQHQQQQLSEHQLQQLHQQQQLEQLQQLHIAHSRKATKVTTTAAHNLPIVHRQIQQSQQQQRYQRQQQVVQPRAIQQIPQSMHQNQEPHIMQQQQNQKQPVMQHIHPVPQAQQWQEHFHHQQPQQQETDMHPSDAQQVHDQPNYAQVQNELQQCSQTSTSARANVSAITENHLGPKNGPLNASNNNNFQSLGIAKIKCEECDKIFATEADLKVHQQYHQSPVAKDFRVRKHCFELVEDMQSPKPYSCSYCPKMFTYWSSLKTHEFTHTGNPPFACSVCDEKFTQSSDLKFHERTHFGANSFKCGKCGRLFKHRPSLMAHENSHHGEDGKNVCPVCLKNFSVGSNLRDHLRIHTGERPYECASCGRGFIQKSHLRKHVMIHTGERPFKCSFCCKGFTQRGDVRRHEKIHQKVK